MDPSVKKKIVELRGAGKTVTEISRELGVSIGAVSKYAREGKTVRAAIVGMPRRTSTKDEPTLRFGDFEIDNTNPFIKYEQLGSVDIVSDAIDRVALEIASGFELYVENDNARAQDILDEVNAWAAEVNLDALLFNIAREFIEKGTVCVYLPQKKGKIETLEILPMRYVTLLPEGVSPGSMPTYILKGEIKTIYIQEGLKGTEIKQQNYERDEVAIFRHNHKTHFFKDVKGRMTYGMYGRSFLDKIEWRLEKYFDLLESYRRFVNRYGYGRLFINYHVLEEMLREGRYKEVESILKDATEKQAQIEENQDFIGTGFQVQQLETKTGLDILGMKESLERDIATALLQSEVTSGKARGTTFASAYLTEEDRIRVLESLRRQIRRTLEREVIRKQLQLLGYEDVMVKIRFDPLKTEKYDLRTLVEAYSLDLITMAEWRERAGFPPEKPRPLGP